MVVVFVVGFTVLVVAICALLAMVGNLYGTLERENKQLKTAIDAARDKIFDIEKELCSIADFAGLKWDEGAPPRWVKKK